MKYSELNDIFDKVDLFGICSTTGKTPKEVVKHFFEIENDLELWNKCHIEYGYLKYLEKEEDPKYNGSYIIKAKWKQKSGEEKNTRSFFVNDAGELYEKWSSYIGDYCKFYVSYNENKEDGTIFRVLIDVERPK